MVSVVVPFRGAGGKHRLAVPEPARAELALAMLGDVLEACVSVGPTVVVTNDEAAAELAAGLGATRVADPGGGQGAAVAAALSGLPEGPALVVNADLPLARRADLEALLAAVPPGGLAYVPAADGTTNALGLSSPSLFAPLYGPGSAARFAAHVTPAVAVSPRGLVQDVDTVADLERIGWELVR